MIRWLYQTFPQIDFQFSDYCFPQVSENMNSRCTLAEDSTVQSFLISLELWLNAFESVLAL